ncbi:MAG: sigma-54 dependent transcriptional regulator [Candidatus Brocadiia bacterium]
MKILLADDEKTITVTLSDALRDKGHTVAVAYDGLSALQYAETDNYDCVLLDIKMPGTDGMEVLRRLKKNNPDLPVIMITGYGTADSAIQALKEGAYDYIQKPFYNNEILLLLEKIEKFRSVKDDYRKVRSDLNIKPQYVGLVGKSPKMAQVYQMIESVAGSDTTVLIEGESGTGKELIAEAIHYKSTRRDNPLVKFGCHAVPETLIESDLFGHEKGSFTDARAQKIGRFELADKGTIFIDDIDDMPLSIQTKFLRVLQEHTFERIGSTSTIKVDIRITAASKKDLFEMVTNNRFREDLFYRLKVITIKIPPLRDRTEDIPLLVEHFIRKFSPPGKEYKIEPETLLALTNHKWPGNVRELENSVSRAITLAGPSMILERKNLLESSFSPLMDGKDMVSLNEFVKHCEKDYIQRLFIITKADKGEMSRILQISRKTLWEKLKKYGIDT